MFYYETPPIDYFAGMVTFDEFCAQIRREQQGCSLLGDEVDNYVIEDMINSLERTKKFFTCESSWEGDIVAGPFVFTIPDPNSSSFKEGFVWKQDNNGMSFIASPCPIPWLKEHLIGNDEPSIESTLDLSTKDMHLLRDYLKDCLSIIGE